MELETDLQKDLLPDFLHLYHAFGNHRDALLSLLQHCGGNPSRARDSDPGELRELGFGARAIARIASAAERSVESDLDWSARAGNRLICYDDDSYPDLLRQTADFPLLLYAHGNPDLLRSQQIAIVGSRRCTPGGARNAFDFASELASIGVTVTSGLALGIDAEAHRGALQADGKTLAVIATGVDIDYPATNRRLAARIRESGLIVSEFPPGSPARRAHFPRRNRIISGLSLATLVVEAARRSGSLITAAHAADQGREVFVIPGSIHNPLTRGCHDLIRDGATLVESAAEIARELEVLAGRVFSPPSQNSPGEARALDPAHRRLLDAIGYDPVHYDIIAARSGLTIDQLSSMLLLLELNDLIQPAPGGCFVRTQSEYL